MRHHAQLVAVEGGSDGPVYRILGAKPAGFDDPVFWDPKIKAPNCFNPPAARSVGAPDGIGFGAAQSK